MIGSPPSKQIVDDLSLVNRKFLEKPGCCVAVPCAAGLGRAPVLAAFALAKSAVDNEEEARLTGQEWCRAATASHCCAWGNSVLKCGCF